METAGRQHAQHQLAVSLQLFHYELSICRVHCRSFGQYTARLCTLPPQASRPQQAEMTSAAASSKTSSSACIASSVKQRRGAGEAKLAKCCDQYEVSPVVASTFVNRDTAPACLACNALKHQPGHNRCITSPTLNKLMIGGLTSSAYASLSMTASAICCIACLLHTDGLSLDGSFKSITLCLSPTNLVERLFWVRHKMLSHFSIRSEATSNSSQSNSSAILDQCRGLALPLDRVRQ